MLKQKQFRPCDIKTDHSYQRPLDEEKAQRIADNLELDRIGVAEVSLRKNGEVYVLDGQTRLQALRMAGHAELPVLCLVHEGLSVEEEAIWFLKLNNGRTAVEAMAKFKARLKGKEPVALEINTVLKSVGLYASPSPGGKSVCAIQAVEWVHLHRKNLAATLTALLPLSERKERAFDGFLLRSVAIFLAEYTEADPSVLAQKIRTEEPIDIIGLIKKEARDYPRWVAQCLVLRRFYNKKNKCPLPPLSWQNV